MQCTRVARTLLPTRAPPSPMLYNISSPRSILGPQLAQPPRLLDQQIVCSIKITPLNYPDFFPLSHPVLHFARCTITRRGNLLLSFTLEITTILNSVEHPNSHTHTSNNNNVTGNTVSSHGDRKQSGRILMDYTCRHRLLRVRGPLISPIIVYVRRINTVFY